MLKVSASGLWQSWNYYNIVEFGAFVQLPGFQRHGLVHVSQMAKFHVTNASDNVATGDKVWVKVIGIGEGNKISLSMRVVDQQTGTDLDPNNGHPPDLSSLPPLTVFRTEPLKLVHERKG